MDVSKKVHLEGDVITYDGDQIAFLIDHERSKEVELSLTGEDLANGEVPFLKRKEILENRDAIVEVIRLMGFSIVNPLHENPHEY